MVLSSDDGKDRRVASTGGVRRRRAPFKTRIDWESPPQWGPLEAVSVIARRSPELPSFHPSEFMYMGVVRRRDGLQVHLYKHIDTRCYLNLDDDGHAYEYRGSSGDLLADPSSGGWYRPHRSLEDALLAADLWLFDEEPAFWRSYPPASWPPLTE